MMNKAELEHGAYYKGKCRNAVEARWDGEKERFIIWRTKFSSKFLEDVPHPDDEYVYDVFVAYHKVDLISEDIPLK